MRTPTPSMRKWRGLSEKKKRKRSREVTTWCTFIKYLSRCDVLTPPLVALTFFGSLRCSFPFEVTMLKHFPKTDKEKQEYFIATGGAGMRAADAWMARRRLRVAGNATEAAALRGVPRGNRRDDAAAREEKEEAARVVTTGERRLSVVGAGRRWDTSAGAVTVAGGWGRGAGAGPELGQGAAPVIGAPAIGAAGVPVAVPGEPASWALPSSAQAQAQSREAAAAAAIPGLQVPNEHRQAGSNRHLRAVPHYTSGVRRRAKRTQPCPFTCANLPPSPSLFLSLFRSLFVDHGRGRRRSWTWRRRSLRDSRTPSRGMGAMCSTAPR